ncbi:MAG: hypothetical protein H0T13_08590 [Actinobacteria bacterium]|nr:hypothetical protein [Actinomycetota bacterium]
MEGFDVLTFDGDKAGKVVGKQGTYLVVEQGAIFKHRRALPEVFATVDEADHVVRTTLSRELLESAPKLDDDTVDQHATARHYGLAAGDDAPATLGYGDLAPNDPALSAEQQETRNGLESAAEQRARSRSNIGAGQGPNDRG